MPTNADNLSKLDNEPVALPALLTGAITATFNVIALIVDISSDVVAGVNIAVGAWMGVLGFWVRSKVVSVKAMQALQDDLGPDGPA